MAPHSSTLAWKIPWTEEPGGLQSMGSLRVGHNWATSFHFSLSCIGEGNGNPLQCSCLENPRDGKAWWAAVYGVAQSRTRLKRLRSSSSREQITHWDCGWSKAYRRLEERGGRFQPSSRSKEWWTKWTRESSSFWVTLKFNLKCEAFI